jgi:hypothetical protein
MQLKHAPVDLFSYTDETNCNTRNINMQNIAALKLPPEVLWQRKFKNKRTFYEKVISTLFHLELPSINYA